MATVNGATALERKDVGSLEPGKQARIIYVDAKANSSESAAHELIWNEHEEVEWI